MTTIPARTSAATGSVSRSLSGKVAIVTGASSGIGAATANELARRGARVVLAARRFDALEALAQRICADGGEALAHQVDVAETAQLAPLVERTLATYGQIDLLVNNAGIGMQPISTATPEEIERMVSVNLLGPMLLTRAVLPHMLERRQGSIVFVASVAGHIAINALYSSTKFGVRGFARSLRRELKGSGVGVSCVSPGFIRTQLRHGMKMPLPGPDVVARRVADLALRPRREVVVPGYYWLPIWTEQLVPGLVDLVLPASWRR